MENQKLKYQQGQYCYLVVDNVRRAGHIVKCDHDRGKLLIEYGGDIYERTPTDVEPYVFK